jgi:transposase
MGKLYDTELSDAAWALVEPHLPVARAGGRPRRKPAAPLPHHP